MLAEEKPKRGSSKSVCNLLLPCADSLLLCGGGGGGFWVGGVRFWVNE